MPALLLSVELLQEQSRAKVDAEIARNKEARRELKQGWLFMVFFSTPLALCLERLDRPEEAADLYRRAIVADSTFVEAWNNLGVYHARNGRLDEAVRHWERTLQIRPDHGRAQDNLERARARIQNPAREADSRSETGG